MKAVRIPIVGPVQVVEVDEPDDEDARAFLADLYSVIGCTSVECLPLTDYVDAWLDETGWIDGQPPNPQATRLGRACGIPADLHGVVVVLGADHTNGQPVGLTEHQVHDVVQRAHESGPPSPGLATEPATTRTSSQRSSMHDKIV